jgi:transposase
MIFLGVDLHTNCFSCCYLGSDGSREAKTFKMTSEDLDHFYQTLTKETYVLIEATINTFAFAALFTQLVAKIIIANTYKLKTISFTDKKTDKIDAEKLARILKMQIMSGEESIYSVTIPPKIIQDLRSLFSTYQL